MTDYPNREHKNTDESVRRRALRALDDIEGEVTRLRRRIANNVADGDDTSTLTERTAEVTRHLSILGALREVREWDAADRAGHEARNG